MPTDGQTPRPRREGDQLRGELLEAAAALAATPRPVAIPSLRAVARACGVSAAAVYRHFPSQGALTLDLLTSVHDDFEASVVGADDPGLGVGERMRRLARAYVRWGLANPGLYQLLMESADQLDPESSLSSGADAVLALAGRLLGGDQRAAERLWSGLHGLVSLRIHKPDEPWAADPETEAETIVAKLR